MAASHRFRDLDRSEIDDVLRRNQVGRIAFSFHDRVDIRPIHYVFDDGWIVGRTSDGTLLETVRHNYWVAFEVDEIDGPFDWRSVVVRGGFYPLDPNASDADREIWDDAVSKLRARFPSAFSDDDPVPFRTTLFRIAVQEVGGRDATSETG